MVFFAFFFFIDFISKVSNKRGGGGGISGGRGVLKMGDCIGKNKELHHRG